MLLGGNQSQEQQCLGKFPRQISLSFMISERHRAPGRKQPSGKLLGENISPKKNGVVLDSVLNKAYHFNMKYEFDAKSFYAY